MTADAGDIYLSGLGTEVRQQVLVLSSARFHRIAERAIVAPLSGARPYPWRIEVDDDTYAIDLLRTVPTEVLLERLGRAPQEAVRQAHRAVQLVM